MDFSRKVEKDLIEMKDLEYKEFHKRILNDENAKLIGIRLPKLREYAKKTKKEYGLQFLLDNINENYYEEIMLKGILIGEYKNLDIKDIEKYIKYYVPKISNWAICDTFCSGLKITKRYKDEIWKIIKKYLQSNEEFGVRFALVMILNYYITDEFIYEIFDIINNVKIDKYYTKMANAWLISYCVIKYYDKTLNFLKNECIIDTWTYNKGIQKSIESYRLTKEQKEELKKLKK